MIFTLLCTRNCSLHFMSVLFALHSRWISASSCVREANFNKSLKRITSLKSSLERWGAKWELLLQQVARTRNLLPALLALFCEDNEAKKSVTNARIHCLVSSFYSLMPSLPCFALLCSVFQAIWRVWGASLAVVCNILAGFVARTMDLCMKA